MHSYDEGGDTQEPFRRCQTHGLGRCEPAIQNRVNISEQNHDEMLLLSYKS